MSKTIKIAGLATAGAVVLAILLFASSGLFLESEEEQAGLQDSEEVGGMDAADDPEIFQEDNDLEAVIPEDEETGDSGEVEIAEDAEFASTDGPYRAYRDALENGKPVVLKFYART